MSLVGNGEFQNSNLPTYIVHSSDDTAEIDDDGEGILVPKGQYKVDIRTTTVIRGASSNDPRIIAPTQMEASEYGRPKRNSFACVSCHSLKQKCVASDLNDIYRKPCKRCLKNHKLCKFDLSKRTRKRKRVNTTLSSLSAAASETRPSDLQGKSSFNGNSAPQPSLPGIQHSLPHLWSNIQQASNHNVISNMFSPKKRSSNDSLVVYTSKSIPAVMTGVTADTAMLPNDETNRKKPQLYHMKPIFKKQLHSLLTYQKGKVGEISSKLDAWTKQWNGLVQSGMPSSTVSDPVSLGIVRIEEAELRLDLYKTEFSSKCKLPFIRLPSNTTVDQLRREKPILFAVIMACVSVIMTSEKTTRDTNMKLDSFVLNLITDQIFKLNNKSIELIESLLTLCLWYNFPEWSNKTRYHIFNYVCVCLVRDLGPTFVNRAFCMFSDEDPTKWKPDIKAPLELYSNGARLTLLVYISSLNISIFLRQSIQARWSALTEKACERVLSNLNSEDELYDPDDDKIIVVFARLNYILEKIHIHLHEMSEAREEEDDPEFTKKHVANLIKKFQCQLSEIFGQIPKNRHRELSFFYSVEAYLYQYIIGSYIGKLPTKFTTDSLPADVSDAVEKCYNYCVSALEEFLKMTPKLVASIPLFHMSRIIYTVGMLLLKLRYSVVVLPSFRHFGQLTQNSVMLVNQVAKLLEESSKIYKFNNFLYKFQYVVALFAQTYANKVSEVANLSSKKKAELNSDKNTLQANAKRYNDGAWMQTYTSTPAQSASSIPGILTQKTMSSVPNMDGDPNVNDAMKNNIIPHSATEKSAFVSPDIRPSPSASSDTINEYLTDVDSLMWGFNALNEEFWTDIFINDM